MPSHRLDCAAQVDTDFTNDDDVRVILIVHDTKPPFLDGRTVFTKQARPVPVAQQTSGQALGVRLRLQRSAARVH